MNRFHRVTAFAYNLDDVNNIITNVLLEKFSKILKKRQHYNNYNIDEVYDAFKKLKDSNILESINIDRKIPDSYYGICFISIDKIESLIKSEDITNKSINKLDKLFRNYYKKEVFK